MKILISILGTSAIAALVTAVFSFLQNRKNNSLSYITEERKIWRERIREIADGIEKSKYKGKKKEDINQYLTKLEMNINPYGRTVHADYMHDGNIWTAIENVQNSDGEEEFVKNKRLLLNYISLMLKMDWERSKEEIKGINKMGISIILSIIMYVYLFFYYFVIWGLKNVDGYILGVMPLLLLQVIVFMFLADTFQDKRCNKISIDEIVKNERKKKKNEIGVIISMVAFGIYLEWLFLYFFPELAKKSNVRGLVRLNSSLNENMTLIGYGSIFAIFVGISICFISKDKNKWDMKREVEKIQASIRGEAIENYNIVKEIFDQVDSMEENDLKSEKCADLLGVAYEALNKVERALEVRIEDLHNEMLTVEEVVKWEECNENLRKIKEMEKKLKCFPRKRSTGKRKSIIEEIKAELE